MKLSTQIAIRTEIPEELWESDDSMSQHLVHVDNWLRGLKTDLRYPGHIERGNYNGSQIVIEGRVSHSPTARFWSKWQWGDGGRYHCVDMRVGNCEDELNNPGLCSKTFQFTRADIITRYERLLSQEVN